MKLNHSNLYKVVSLLETALNNTRLDTPVKSFSGNNDSFNHSCQPPDFLNTIKFLQNVCFTRLLKLYNFLIKNIVIKKSGGLQL